MDDKKSAEPTTQTTHPELPTITIEVGACPTCGYDLKGQPVPGICPECGNKYASQSELPLRAKPSALKICLLYGWPLLAFVLSFGMLIDTSNDPYAPAGWMGVCLLIFAGSVINGGIMTVWFIKRHRPQDCSNLKGLNQRMKFVGGSVAFMFYMMVVFPLVIGGGCTLIMVGLFGILS